MLISSSENQKAHDIFDELKQSQARFQAIFENTAIGIGIMGLDRRIIDANPALCRIFGRSRKELIGQTPDLVTYPEDYEKSTNDFNALITGEIEAYHSERRYVRKNGEVFWAHVTMSFVRDTDNRPIYIVGMVLDINDKKLAQLELLQSEARFRAMFDNSAIGMTLSTLDRHVLKINEALTRITGFSLDDLKTLHPNDLAHPEDRHLGSEGFAELLAGKRTAFSLERRYFRKDGTMFWGRVTYSLVYDVNGEPCNLVGLMEDITEQKDTREKILAQEVEYRLRLEQEVEERTRELKQINQQLEDEVVQRQKAEQALANKAAHDAILNERTRLARELHDAVTQTLFSASLIAEVLPDLWDLNPAEGEKRLGELRQLTRGALAEMRTLLVELRPNALAQIPLPELLRQLCESLIGRARLPVEFNAEGQIKIPPEVQMAFYRVTQEALNNVVKHAKATKVDVSLRMGTSVRLKIVDDGCGFDLDTVSPDHLGLNIMCERAEAIGADCSLNSQPGKGTQITLVWHCPSEDSEGCIK